MISEIKLHQIATYINETTMVPKAINFCYGSNGSGKSTIARFLDKKKTSPYCSIAWHQEELPILTYSRDFVETNFGESISGIFTLGEDSKETRSLIAAKQEEKKKVAQEMDNLLRSQNSNTQEQQQESDAFEATCWAVQQTHGSTFRNALVGFRGSKREFSNKCMSEYSDINETVSIDEIKQLYSAAFDSSNDVYQIFKQIDTEEALRREQCDLLGKHITGSTETPIGKFIEFLGNSDWVKQGFFHAHKSSGKCPYCQQELPAAIQKGIEDFFDEAYERECSVLKQFVDNYRRYEIDLLAQIDAIIQTKYPILSYDWAVSEYSTLSKIIEANQRVLDDKLRSPSSSISIESIEPILIRINEQLASFNQQIESNNRIVVEQEKSKELCQKQVWKFFTYELREPIRQYKRKALGLRSGAAEIQKKIDTQKALMQAIDNDIAEKERTLTSVAPTVAAINGILERFGFTGFKLEENISVAGTYKIIRPDGSDARRTLSEGEHNFISFLYFYQLVLGSHNPTGIDTDKIVVIDDPISSLDSNVLFIITTLVKSLINDCLEQKHGVKQIFILTHNVYFHKEITFRGSRSKYPTKKTAYWIIKKNSNVSEIVCHEKNPIQTSYELLWTELKNTDNTQRVTIFNTLRRILEYYFNIIGGLDYETCIDAFEGKDKILCKALISSINDGSHFISDDFVMCYESDTVQNYLRVFRMIFEKMDHESHYKMMMAE